MIKTDHKAIFYEKGWVKIPNFFDRKKIKSVKLEVSKILLKKNLELKFGEAHYVKDKIFTIHVLDSISHFFRKFKKDKKIVNLAEYIIGKKVVPQWVQLFAKPAKIGLETPPHQDNYFWCVNGCETMTCWITLEKVSKKNGGLYYYNNSNKFSRLEHKNSYSKGTSQTISKKGLKKLGNCKKEFISAKPGDLIIHHGYVVHGSKRNNSTTSRKAISIWFKSKASKYNLLNLKKYKLNLKKQHLSLQKTKY